MRRLLLVACWLFSLIDAAPARADGPPYDYARGAGDRFTGVIASAVAAEGITKQLGYPSVEAGTGGAVGIRRSTGAGRPHAFAYVDLAQATVLDPDAVVCIRIAGAGLPNIIEGGGPVCRSLDSELGQRLEGSMFIETYAELRAPRDSVDAEVFVTWTRHPVETGVALSGARVLEIGFNPA